MNRPGPGVVLGLALALLLGGCGSDDTHSTSSSTTTSAAATGELVFFNPTWLPAGVTVLDVTLQRGEEESPAWGAKLGRANGVGKFRDVVTVVVSEAAQPREVGQSEEKASRRVDVNGQSARAMDSSVVGSTVSWHQDGYEVGVIGESGASDDVLDVARRVRLAAAGRAEDTRLDGVPAGMAIIGDGGFGAYPRIRYLINAVGDGAGTNASVNIDVSLVPSGLPAAILGAGTELDATRQARGHAAFLFRQSTDIGGHTLEQVTLSWAERPDLLVVIGGTITGDDAVAIAHGLREETEQKWRSQLPVRDQAP